MRKLSYTIPFIVLIALSLASCLKKNYDLPPDLSDYDPQLAITHNIAALLRMNGPFDANNGGDTTLIQEEIIITGIVTANDKSGNFYKRFVIQDDSAAITVLVNSYNLYTQYPVGRKIYIKCKGLYLGYENGLPVVGASVSGQMSMLGIEPGVITDYIELANINNPVKIDTFSLAEIRTPTPYLLNKIVCIKDVQFTPSGVAYAQPNAATSRIIEDCFKNDFVVRTSNYANFSAYTVPGGKGSITGIYTIYSSSFGMVTAQLVLRDTTDIYMNGARCSGSTPNTTILIDETFETLTDWNAVSLTGDQKWNITQYGNPKPCAMMSGYAGGNKENEDWLISKQIDASGFNKLILKFESAGNYSGNPLETYISSNYIGMGDPNAAAWTKLSAAYDELPGFEFTPSGEIDLSGYAGQKIYIAFKYTSTNSAAASWEVDNVKLIGK